MSVYYSVCLCYTISEEQIISKRQRLQIFGGVEKGKRDKRNRYNYGIKMKDDGLGACFNDVFACII